ncbi:GvpL/GvpF family gas vesicle protein [Peterkaempfera bronchialis]|uniref:GvpL/GvpF family gas vesicle protein n=1 Tax=Peterkaempfera bronchialis TaxID=2126346 RepID=UPI003C2DB2DD
MTEATATWLYAVARGLPTSALDDVTGVAAEPVRLLSGHGLQAVVGSVPLRDFAEDALHDHLEDLNWLETAVRAHHRVIDAAAGATRVLPLRFATLYRDDQRVHALLDQQQDAFGSALDRVAGHTEWGVKVYADPRAFAPEAPEPAGAANPGTAYLLRRRAQRDERQSALLRAQRCAEEIAGELGPLAAETASHPPQDPRLAEYQGWMLLNDSYLVPDARAREFAARVHALQQRFEGVRLQLSGPWPAYSFTAVPATETEAER